LRKDEILKQPSEKIQKLIELAPQKEKNYLKVKSIL
jgi:Asp-tRNA(Asn)/Glu-tRNA(Gln) amidotransferase C subunit